MLFRWGLATKVPDRSVDCGEAESIRTFTDCFVAERGLTPFRAVGNPTRECGEEA